jgi:cysteinyl-tRNA synthetase
MNQDFFIYNTLTRKKEKFEPIHPKKVGMYVCGPTVYSDVHMGNCRTFISFDLLYRYLTHLGYQVRYVRNITDAGHLESDGDVGEDKVSKKAKLEQLEPMEIVQRYTVDFRNVMNLFNVLPPNIEPTATGHIIEQQDMTKKIMESGYAYESNGTIYFDVEKFAQSHNYTALTGRKLEDLLDNTRDLDGQKDKKGRLDFALWIKAKPEHLMQWGSPWGTGFPGWHIECSAMSKKYLGEKFDIHGGGMDLAPTHHTNEIAQNIAFCGETPANYWMHTNMLTVKGQKMSKSLGNSFLPHELFSGDNKLLSKGYSPMAVRFFMLQTHYASTLDFSDEALQASEKGFLRIIESTKTLEKLVPSDPDSYRDSTVDVAKIEANCYAAMNDDLNTSVLIAELFECVRVINSTNDGNEKLTIKDIETLKRIYQHFLIDILGIKLEANDGKSIEALTVAMDLLMAIRQQAKANKDFATADQIRNELTNKGIQIKDGKEGVTWSI